MGVRGFTGLGLQAKVLHGIGDGLIAGFHAEVTALRATRPVYNQTDFNTHFAALRSVIEDPTVARERRFATTAYLAGATRNQVQHLVDTGMVLFTDRDAASFTVGALLSLCRLSGWVA